MLRRLLFLAAGGSLVALACSSSAGSAASDLIRPSHSDTDAGASGAVSIRVGNGEGLDLVTSAPQKVDVQIEPPGVYTVRFSLVEDAADAFLDKSQTDTAADGSASVLLTPPSSPRFFKLRASVGSVWSQLPIHSTTDVTTVDVVPVYAGKRAISVWFASVGAGLHCDPTTPV